MADNMDASSIWNVKQIALKKSNHGHTMARESNFSQQLDRTISRPLIIIKQYYFPLVWSMVFITASQIRYTCMIFFSIKPVLIIIMECKVGPNFWHVPNNVRLSIINGDFAIFFPLLFLSLRCHVKRQRLFGTVVSRQRLHCRTTNLFVQPVKDE